MAERLGDALALRRPQQPGLHAAPLGRLEEAYAEFAGVLPTILAEDVPDVVLTSCEDFACVLFDMGRERDGALLVGAAMAERDDAGVPRMDFQEAALEPSIAAGGPGSATSGSRCSTAVPSSASSRRSPGAAARRAGESRYFSS